MNIKQLVFTDVNQINELKVNFKPNLILIFVSAEFPNIPDLISKITTIYPDVLLFGCTTSGEITSNKVYDESAVISIIQFKKTHLRLFATDLSPRLQNIEATGRSFINRIDQQELKHLIVLSSGGIVIGGSQLIRGMNSALKPWVSITGGLAGFSTNKQAFVIHNGKIEKNKIVALGMYGEKLHVGYQSVNGFDSFGVEGLVTESKENVIYSIDDAPALDFYIQNIGEENFAKIKEGNGLKYPMRVRNRENSNPITYIVLDISETEKTITLSSIIPEGSYIRNMKANTDRLINNVDHSTKILIENLETKPNLALLVSCMGRKEIMKDLVKEEVEAVLEHFPKKTKAIGFYSASEISPFFGNPRCSFHNLTMCVTTFSES